MHRIFKDNIGKCIRFKKDTIKFILNELFDEEFICKFNGWIQHLLTTNSRDDTYVLYRGELSFGYYYKYQLDSDIKVVNFNIDSLLIGEL